MNSDALWTVLATILLAMMLLDHGSAGYGVGEPFDGTTTSTREEVMGGPMPGTSTKGSMLLDVGVADYGVMGTSDWTTDSVRKGMAGGQRLERQVKGMYTDPQDDVAN